MPRISNDVLKYRLTNADIEITKWMPLSPKCENKWINFDKHLYRNERVADIIMSHSNRFGYATF